MPDRGTQTTPAGSLNAARGGVRLRWWKAGGLHVHITYPDGSWERRVWAGEPYWEIDSLVLTLERDGYSVDVIG